MEWLIVAIIAIVTWRMVRSRPQRIDPRAFAQVFWRCPLCHAEEALTVQRQSFWKPKLSVDCASCNARWEALTLDGMTLVSGRSDRLGRRTLDEWAELASGPVELKALEGVSLPVLMKRGEVPIKVGRAASYRERTRTIRSSGSYTGVSVRIARGVRLSTGAISRGPSQTVTETVTEDRGEFVLTNQRLIFNGNKKAANMELKKIVAVDVEDGFLEVGYGTKTHRFTVENESLYKWRTYIRGVAEIALGGQGEGAVR